MKYKLAIFDLDGTILNTLDDLYNSVNYALEMHNMPKRSKSEVRSYIGGGIAELVRKSAPENSSVEETQQVLLTFKEHYSKHSADETKPYDGVIEFLNKLKSAGIKMAVVSNKADKAVQELCKKYFDGYFEFVVGERENVRKKPFPDSIFEVIKHFSVKNEDCIYIGDSEVDIETANNAEIAHIIVPWGFRDRDVLIKHGAKIIITESHEILDFFV